MGDRLCPQDAVQHDILCIGSRRARERFVAQPEKRTVATRVRGFLALARRVGDGLPARPVRGKEITDGKIDGLEVEQRCWNSACPRILTVANRRTPGRYVIELRLLRMANRHAWQQTDCSMRRNSRSSRDVLIDERSCTTNNASEGPRSVPSNARSTNGPGEPHHLFSNVDRRLNRRNRLSFCRRVPSSLVVTPINAEIRCRWNAGCAIRRWRSQKSPSLVRRPLASTVRSLSQSGLLRSLRALILKNMSNVAVFGNPIARSMPMTGRPRGAGGSICAWSAQQTLAFALPSGLASRAAWYLTLSVELRRLHAGMTRARTSLDSSQLRGGV